MLKILESDLSEKSQNELSQTLLDLKNLLLAFSANSKSYDDKSHLSSVFKYLSKEILPLITKESRAIYMKLANKVSASIYDFVTSIQYEMIEDCFISFISLKSIDLKRKKYLFKFLDIYISRKLQKFHSSEADKLMLKNPLDYSSALL